MFHQSGKLDEARRIYEDILATEPRHFDCLHLLGVLAGQSGNHQRAADLMGQAAEINPGNADCHLNRGLALRKLGQLEAALASFDAAIALRHDHAESHSNRGLALQELGQPQRALESCERAVALKPELAYAHYNLGNVLQELRQSRAAVAAYDRAVALEPDFAEAHYNRGVTLKALNEPQAAVDSCDRAIAIRPDFAEAHANRGLALGELKQWVAALESFDRAIAIRPDYAEAHSNRGNVLVTMQRLHEGVACFDQAIALRPDLAEAHSNRGQALRELMQLDAALESMDRAIALKPDLADAYAGRGHVLEALGRLEAALEDFDRAIALKPDYSFLPGTRLHAQLDLCDWDGFEGNVRELAGRIERGEKASPPFSVLAIADSPPLQKRAAEIFVEARHPADNSLGAFAARGKSGSIRIGYFSADFRQHAVALLTAGLFESHDRERFETLAFSYGPEDRGDMRRRLASAFDQFIDVAAMSDAQVAALAREKGVDIAIDLGGHTQHARIGIFALRAAPVQASYIGYLGTTGARYIDYLFADDTIIPEPSRRHYSEKIVYLPSYQANDSRRIVPAGSLAREELGLPPTGFVFCCLSNSYKLSPSTFSGWMRILSRVEGSVLLLYVPNFAARSNLAREAARRGVDPGRILFADLLPLPEYLARFRATDLFLDTLPYNAGTVTSDALWAGLPVLTLTGQSFAARMGGSLLNAIGLPELVARTQEEYEALAIEMATSPAKLSGIRARLERNRFSTPLFDTIAFTRNMEAAYSAMHERYHAGFPPEHITIEP